MYSYLKILTLSFLITAGVLAAGGSQEEVVSADRDYRDPLQLKELISEAEIPYLLIDVRTPGEYAGGYIPQAINIPVDVIGTAIEEVDRDELIILYCRSGNRSAVATGILEGLGYTHIVDFGGISRWPYELAYP
ncbi:MAG: rhodanese-like domain-containing protein [Spirochaetia bacterium]|nr:rhodanese-like domain-containing protein [Spirochaetia bacterium]